MTAAESALSSIEAATSVAVGSAPVVTPTGAPSAKLLQRQQPDLSQLKPVLSELKPILTQVLGAVDGLTEEVVQLLSPLIKNVLDITVSITANVQARDGGDSITGTLTELLTAVKAIDGQLENFVDEALSTLLPQLKPELQNVIPLVDKILEL